MDSFHIHVFSRASAVEFLASATAGMLGRNQVSSLLSIRLGEGTVAYYPGNVQQALEVTDCVYYRSVTRLMGSWELDASLNLKGKRAFNNRTTVFRGVHSVFFQLKAVTVMHKNR